jgi:hypothetical protein
MEKAVASQVVDAILAVERELGVLSTLSNKIAGDEEKTTFRKSLAQIIVLYTDMLMSVVNQYPDLDPDPPSNSADENRD